MSAAFMAFLHHVAAFTVVAALGVEIALFTPPLSLAQARRLQRTDSIFGVAAGVLLVVGLLLASINHARAAAGRVWNPTLRPPKRALPALT
jgi:uncharacterized membrane protein